MRFSQLAAGYEFPPLALALDEETVRRYLVATGDDTSLYWRDGVLRIVPPLAVAALAFRGMAHDLALEPGSLHTSQDLTCRRPVTVSERLTLQATVATASQRRGFTALAIDLAVTDDSGEETLAGRMTLLVAGQEGGTGDPPTAGQRPDLIDDLDTATVQPATYEPLSPSGIVAGTELSSLQRTVTQERIAAYALASGDYNPIHLDPQFAVRSPFGRTVAHGMLLLSYISTMLTRAFGTSWINTGTLKVKFRKPALVDTTVTARGRVERVIESDGVHYAICALRLDDAAGDELLTGEARVHISR